MMGWSCGMWTTRAKRQREKECCSWTFGRSNSQAPSVRFHDRPADCQAHPHSFLLRSIESLKGLFRIKQASSVVPDLDNDRRRVLQLRADPKFSWPILNCSHRLDSIDEQVEDDLLQLHSITQHKRELS